MARADEGHAHMRPRRPHNDSLHMDAGSLSDAELFEEAKRRGIPIRNAALFRQALTHKSSVPDTPLESNERLEFLGDAVLGLVIGQYLYETFPEREEGDLAKSRSLVVSKAALADAARRMNLVPLLQLGATEEAMGGRSRSSLVADAYEAILAVVYLESGLAPAREFVLSTLSPALEQMRAASDLRDPKTILQEYCQAGKHPLPVYRIIAERGKPHDRTFTAEVVLMNRVCGTGTGKSKKEAEQAAAEAALATLPAAT